VVAYLDTSTLKDVALVSQKLYQHATDILWQHLCLADQWKLHVNEQTDQLWGDRGRGESDEHDDTPIIQKLYILATYVRHRHSNRGSPNMCRNPAIASKVQTITHRCHLPTPNIFNELPRMHFDANNLSQDPRLHILLRLAIQNLVNVHTLRIVYGHWKLTNALIAGLLDEGRPRRVPLRKLWLESCCFEKDALYACLPGKATGLESIRLRRLGSQILDTQQRQEMQFMEFKLSRGGQYYQMHNGAGSFVGSTVHFSEEGLPDRWPRPSVEELVAKGKTFDTAIWDELPGIRECIDALPSHMLAPTTRTIAPGPVNVMAWLIQCSASTLTSLNLDWIHWRKKEGESGVDHCSNSSLFLTSLSQLRFPHLRAFQIRNAVLPLTKLPDDVFLLEDTFLEFMEAHPKIQCLGWPMDKVYSHVKPSIDVQSRSRKLVSHLAMMLTDLRMDTQYANHGEPLTDECRTTEETQERTRRRRFIAEFAPHMRKVEQVLSPRYKLSVALQGLYLRHLNYPTRGSLVCPTAGLKSNNRYLPFFQDLY
jgi:hypothetical protein